MKSTPSKSQLIVARNYESLCDAAVQRMLTLIRVKIADQGIFTMALSGGATPKGLYTLMASSKYRNDFPWEKIHLFWGDERWVLPDDVQANYSMIADAILTRVDIPMENIHPIRTRHIDPDQSADLYEQVLKSFFRERKHTTPQFDLMLLGLGTDGHIASIFPGSPALNEFSRLAIPVHHPETGQQRITVTLPVINAADNIFFLVSGREKSEILQRVLQSESAHSQLPVQQVRLDHGAAWWFADSGAASLLKIKEKN